MCSTMLDSTHRSERDTVQFHLIVNHNHKSATKLVYWKRSYGRKKRKKHVESMLLQFVLSSQFEFIEG